jgi:hypothetical protein
MNKNENKKSFKKLGLKIAKATLITAVAGVFWLVLWLLISSLLSDFPGYLASFALLAWALLFFTFAIRVSEGTIYKYILIIARAFFLVVYVAYATNCGVLTVTIGNFTVTVEFIPLLALMIVINLLAMARGLLQAIEFTSQSPKD